MQGEVAECSCGSRNARWVCPFQTPPAFPTHLFADEYLTRNRIFIHCVSFYGELQHVAVIIIDPSDRPFSERSALSTIPQTRPWGYMYGREE